MSEWPCVTFTSQTSCQSKDDVVRNTAGHWIWCKYAVSAHHACYQFYEMCRGAQKRNPLIGHLHSFQNYIANTYKLRTFVKPKRQIATTPLFYNGVQLTHVTNHGPVTRKPTDASLQSFIPASEASAFRETATASNAGNSLAINSNASSTPVHELHNFHCEGTWLNALKDSFCESQALKVNKLQFVQFFAVLVSEPGDVADNQLGANNVNTSRC